MNRCMGRRGPSNELRPCVDVAVLLLKYGLLVRTQKNEEAPDVGAAQKSIKGSENNNASGFG